MSSGEYDLKKSEDKVGQLYPVLLSKDGKIIDGFHRLESDKKWRTETLEHIDDEEKLLLARAISNWHRRAVSRSEKENWINGLARIYLKQGYNVGHRDRGEANEIVNKLLEILGLSRETIINHLDDSFKQKKIGGIPKGASSVPASQAIISTIGKGYGEKLVERHREEVKEEVREEIKEEVTEEVLLEALEDPEFVLKAIEKAPEVLKARPRPVVDREGYHLPTVDETTQREAKQRGVEIAKERKEFIARPDIIEKSRLLKAWRALSVILGSSKDLMCPICNGEAEIILKCKNCGEVPLSEAQRVAKEAVS